MQTLDNLIGRLLAPIDGFKTKLGALMLAFVALNHVVGFVSPATANLIQNLALALAAYGLRDATEKFAKP